MSELPYTSEYNDPAKPPRNFASLGRRSLLSRDPITGVPRELQIRPIDPEGLRDDLLQRVKEAAEEHNSREE